MSTRSTITLINPDLSASQVYCHNDGYLSHNGALLHNCYDTPRKVASLISYGDISALGYTNKQSKAEKDINLMDKVNPFDIAEKLGFGMDSKEADRICDDCARLKDNYTFYYGRDRREKGSDIKPAKFMPALTHEALKNAYYIENTPTKTKALDSNDEQGIILPHEMIEFNYIYDASLKNPTWFVCTIDDNGYWIFKKLSSALDQPKVRKESKELGTDKQDADEFFAHPYNPTIKEFMAQMKRKYSKSTTK